MIGNLNGRINIIYLLAWSTFGVLWCKYYPMLVDGIVSLLSDFNLLNEITILFFIFMLYDCYISIVASYRQKLRRKVIKPRNRYEKWLDNKYSDEILIKIYANARVID